MSSCETCNVPALDCKCCCRERKYLENYLGRLNAFECYLRPLLIAASCSNLSDRTPVTMPTFQGHDIQFKLTNAGSSAIAAASPVTGSDDALANVNSSNSLDYRIPVFVGCNCTIDPQNRTLVYQEDCYGVFSGDANSIMSFIAKEYRGASYVPESAGTNSLSAAKATWALLSNAGTAGTSTVGGLRGAILVSRELRRVYAKLVDSLLC